MTVDELQTPYADLMPPLASYERDALASRIEHEGGVHDPLLATEDGVLLDGHNRMAMAPGKCAIKVLPGSAGWTDAERKAFVIRTNRGRRNLSPDQERTLDKTSRRIAADLKVQGMSQELIGKQLGISQKRVSEYLGDAATPIIRGGYNGCSPDLRIKIPASEKPHIYDRHIAGETTVSLAADYKCSQQHISRIAKSESKRREEIRTMRERLAAAKDKEPVVTESQDVVPCHAVITDPPYAILDEEWEPDDIEGFTREWVTRWATCGADFFAIFWSQRFLWLGRQVFDECLTGYTFQQLLVWVYRNNKSAQSRMGFKQTWEPVFFYRRDDSPKEVKASVAGTAKWGKDLHDMDTHVAGVPQSTFVDQDRKVHPAQKPVSVMRWLVNALTEPGELVCDPFTGSGTTGIAALQLNRLFHGIEVNPEYRQRAEERIRTYGANKDVS